MLDWRAACGRPSRPSCGRRPFSASVVDGALVLVERPVDAVDLLDRHHVGGQLPLDLRQALVVRFLEDLERLHEFVIGLDDIRAGERIGGLGLETGDTGFGGHGSPHDWNSRAARLSVSASRGSDPPAASRLPERAW